MPSEILIVEDEKEIADLLGVYLQNEGYVVHLCYSGQQALQCIEQERLDLAILDVMLPDADGFSLCRTIREQSTYPIILLTARDQEMDKITGLSLGADDYITKPFRPLELVARVKAQLRRYIRYSGRESGQAEQGDIIAVSGLMLDRSTHQCLLNERPLALTPTEFSILWVLCQNRGRVVSAEQLFREVWGEKYFTSSNNTVMVHIRHLRGKMGDSAEHPKYIQTVWGIGYKMDG